MDNLVSILKISTLNIDVKNNILRLIQNWSVAFEGKPTLSYVGQVYRTLMSEGESALLPLLKNLSYGLQVISSRQRISLSQTPQWWTHRLPQNGLTRMFACGAARLSRSPIENIIVVIAAKCSINPALQKQWLFLTLVSPKTSVCVMVVTRNSRERPRSCKFLLYPFDVVQGYSSFAVTRCIDIRPVYMVHAIAALAT